MSARKGGTGRKPPPIFALGPAMSALDERQQKFVAYLVETGTSDHTKAARVAGYDFGSLNSLKVQAWRLRHNPRIQAAIKEAAFSHLAGNALLASHELIRMARDRGHRDQFRALDRLLAASGLHMVSEQVFRVELSSAEIVEKIGALAEFLGLDPSRLLGAAAPNEIKDITPEGGDGAQD